MMDSNLISSNFVFRISRLIGTIPYGSRGKMSKLLTLFFIITTLGTAVPSIGLRVIHLRLSMIYGSEHQKTQILVAVTVSISLIFSNLAHLVQCLQKRKQMEHILQSVPLTSWSSESIFDSVFIVTGTLAHVIFLCLGVFDSNYYNISEKSTAQLVYTVVMLTYYHANLYNLTVAMQFVSVVGAMTNHLNQMVISIEKEFQGSRCLEFIGIARILNESYTWQMTLTLAQISGFTVTYLYIVLSDLIGFGIQRMLSRVLSLGIFTCLSVMRIITLWLIAGRPHRFNKAVSIKGQYCWMNVST